MSHLQYDPDMNRLVLFLISRWFFITQILNFQLVTCYCSYPLWIYATKPTATLHGWGRLDAHIYSICPAFTRSLSLQNSSRWTQLYFASLPICWKITIRSRNWQSLLPYWIIGWARMVFPSRHYFPYHYNLPQPTHSLSPYPLLTTCNKTFWISLIRSIFTHNVLSHFPIWYIVAHVETRTCVLAALSDGMGNGGHC